MLFNSKSEIIEINKIEYETLKK